MSGLTYNIHGQNVPDRLKLFAHLEKLKPPAVVVMDDVKTARDIKALLPNATVIYRFNGDGGDGDLHLKISPLDWLNKMQAKVADNRIMLYSTNEPTLSKQLVDWHCALIKAASERGVSLCVMNLATGNPSPEAWYVARPLLELMAVHRQHIMGIHEYFGGVVTSGIQGGNPSLIMPGMWPAKVVLTRWHLGRFAFLLKYCDDHGIAYPRIGITEHGADDTSDIKPWLSSLKKTPPYTDIRGYRTLDNQWRDWYGGMGWTRGRTYGEMLTWADSAIYQDSPVEFQAVFCWGHSSADWIPFDVAEEIDYQDFIVKYAAEESSTVYPTLPSPLDTRWTPKRNESGDNYRIRPTPIQNEIAWIYKDDEFSYIPDVTFENWIQVKNNAGRVGWADRGVLTLKLPVPPPAPQPPEPTLPPETILTQDINFLRALIAETEKELAPVLEEKSRVDHLAARLQQRITGIEVIIKDLETFVTARVA